MNMKENKWIDIKDLLIEWTDRFENRINENFLSVCGFQHIDFINLPTKELNILTKRLKKNKIEFKYSFSYENEEIRDSNGFFILGNRNRNEITTIFFHFK